MSATSEAECTAHQPRNAVDGQVETEAQQVEAMLLSRAYLYTLFHKCFGGVPTAELLQVLEGGVTADVVDEYAEDDAAFAALKAFLGDLARADQAQLLESARDEYTRLFIGPANLPASPYESPYTGAHDLALFQQNTLDVRAAYHAAGLRLKREQAVPDDHVSLLCAYMAELSKRALVLFREGNFDGFALALRRQGAFVKGHLANWLGNTPRSCAIPRPAPKRCCIRSCSKRSPHSPSTMSYSRKRPHSGLRVRKHSGR